MVDARERPMIEVIGSYFLPLDRLVRPWYGARKEAMMNDIQAYAIRILERSGSVLRNGHFVLNAGDHSDTYFDKWALFADPAEWTDVARLIAQNFTRHGIAAVVGPAHGGILLAAEVARHLFILGGRSVLNFMALRPAPDAAYFVKGSRAREIKGREVLVVEDILTSGATVRGAVGAVRDCGGVVAAVAVIVNRESRTAGDLGVAELLSLVDLSIPRWSAAECLLCRNGVPVNIEHGYGASFVSSGKQDV